MSRTIFAADLFCGAGGTSTGLMAAAARLGYDVCLLAINHWDVAVRTHAANHPSARHLTTGLESVTPADVVPGGRLDLLWASPSCTHHSVARGGRPRSDQSRAQPHLILDWLDQLYVKRVMLENVPEFLSWGPLGVDGQPMKSRKGALFDDYVRSLQARGYRAEWRVLCCADYGDPTTRERFFLQAVRGREKIRWPEPTHSKNPGGLFGGVKRWVPAREIIDWSLHGKSIFRRDRPLSPNTIRRIEAGIERFWGEWAKPFLVLLRGTRDGTLARTAFSLDAPLPTLTSSGHVGLMEPFLIPNFSERDGQRPRNHSIDKPMPTVAGHGAGALIEPFLTVMNNWPHQQNGYPLDRPLPTQTAGNHFGVVEPFIIPQHSCGAPHGMDAPIPTITTDGAHALVRPFLTTVAHGTPDGNFARRNSSVDDPLRTLTATKEQALVEPFLVSFYGHGQALSVDQPFATITTKDRFGIVQQYGLDILFRMLQPHELALAHSFPRDYRFAGNKGDVVRQIGNSVPSKTSEELCYAALSA